MPIWIRKGSKAALEGALREQGGVAREHRGAAREYGGASREEHRESIKGVVRRSSEGVPENQHSTVRGGVSKSEPKLISSISSWAVAAAFLLYFSTCLKIHHFLQDFLLRLPNTVGTYITSRGGSRQAGLDVAERSDWGSYRT